MGRMTASKAREEFADVLNRVAYRGERIILDRRGKALAVLVPVEDLEALERHEDQRDAQEANRRLQDPAEVAVPYEQARRELGLD